MLSACVADVFDETDLYGSFLTEDSTRSVTLAAENSAVVCYGETYETYYARFDLIGGVVELREDGFRGNIVYTFNIENADTLVLVFNPEYPEGVQPPEDDVNKLTFIRDKSFNPEI